MSNILFWTALVIAPVLLGTLFALLRNLHDREDISAGPMR